MAVSSKMMSTKSKAGAREPLPVGLLQPGMVPGGVVGAGLGRMGGTVATAAHVPPPPKYGSWQRVSNAQVASETGSQLSGTSASPRASADLPPSSPAASTATSGGKGHCKGGCGTDLAAGVKRMAIALKEGEPVMPLVRCSHCPHIESWKRMQSIFLGEDEGYERTCWMCVQKREGLEDEAGARYFIVKASPAYARKSKQWKAFEDGKEWAGQLGMTDKKQMRTVAIAAMRDLFSPMLDQLVKKYRHMEMLKASFVFYPTRSNRPSERNIIIMIIEIPERRLTYLFRLLLS